jgi:FkbM family methyltransferase
LASAKALREQFSHSFKPMKNMKKASKIYSEFNQGIIDKPTFIRKMYENYHSILFEYAEHLSKTNIGKIEIEDNQIIMTSRDRGARLLCTPGDFRVVPIEILNFFDYEKAELAMMNYLVTDSDTVFDIGGNVGWYSINLALSRRHAQIHCFEPIPQTFRYLQRNLNLNAVLNVTAHNFGFSDNAGMFDFYFYHEGLGNASSANVSDRDDVQVCQCQVTTVDKFTTEKQIAVDFIKCDVEGAELLVFRGGKKTIARDLPIVFSEILRKWSAKFYYDPNEIFNFFQGLGYQAFTIDNDRLKEFFVMDEKTIETNFFFLHSEKHFRQIRRLCI